MSKKTSKKQEKMTSKEIALLEEIRKTSISNVFKIDYLIDELLNSRTLSKKQ